MRKYVVALAAFGMIAGSAPAMAAACRSAAGKFVKCPPAAAPKAARCKDSKGKFAKCGSPGAKPA